MNLEPLPFSLKNENTVYELNCTTTSSECKCMGHTHRNIVRRHRRTLYHTQMLTRCMHVHCMHASACVCAASCHAPKHHTVQPWSVSEETKGCVNALLGSHTLEHGVVQTGHKDALIAWHSEKAATDVWEHSRRLELLPCRV